MSNENYRDEAVKSLRNRCDIYLVLRSQRNPLEYEPLCMTMLEDIFESAQVINDEYCVDRAGQSA